jgi:phage baseplate assembly protein W
MGANSTVKYYGTEFDPITKKLISSTALGGRGLNYPLGGDAKKYGGTFAANTGIRKVRQALQQILQTERGERVMLPKFGCNLRKFVFQPLDKQTFQQIKEEVLFSLYHYLQGASVQKISVLRGREVGQLGTAAIHIILILKMDDELGTTFSEEITVQ